MSLKLIKLTKEYEKQLVEMIDEWKEDQERNHTNRSPWAIFKNDPHDFGYYLEHLEVKEASDGKVPDSTFFLLDTERNRLLGAVNIRHYLNDALLKDGGHIGDGIRPSERRKGYATEMIRLALAECRKLGIDRVLMVCDKDNIGSARSIIKNGGILENEFTGEDGNIEQRYWIDLRGEEEPKYYAAYEERYKTAHGKDVSWASAVSTPIVMDVIKRYGIKTSDRVLEIGCGEGRDARILLEEGYDLIATDISAEAVSYCRKVMPSFAERFRVLDCLSGRFDETFSFIYAVAVVHMLVLDEDRKGFYRFIRDHLKDGGLALICTMGDGETEMESDISKAFEIQERNHESGKMMVAATSCRLVSFETFEKELKESGLEIAEKGITSAVPEFDSLMYAVVRRGLLDKQV